MLSFQVGPCIHGHYDVEKAQSRHLDPPSHPQDSLVHDGILADHLKVGYRAYLLRNDHLYNTLMKHHVASFVEQHKLGR